MSTDLINTIVTYFLEKGGLFGVVAVVEAFVIYKLWASYLTLQSACRGEREQAQKEREQLQEEHQKEREQAYEERISDLKVLMPIVEANNRVQTISASAQENRTRALDSHTQALEKVVIHLENVQRLIEKSS